MFQMFGGIHQWSQLGLGFSLWAGCHLPIQPLHHPTRTSCFRSGQCWRHPSRGLPIPSKSPNLRHTQSRVVLHTPCFHQVNSNVCFFIPHFSYLILLSFLVVNVAKVLINFVDLFKEPTLAWFSVGFFFINLHSNLHNLLHSACFRFNLFFFTQRLKI